MFARCWPEVSARSAAAVVRCWPRLQLVVLLVFSDLPILFINWCVAGLRYPAAAVCGPRLQLVVPRSEALKWSCKRSRLSCQSLSGAPLLRQKVWLSCFSQSLILNQPSKCSLNKVSYTLSGTAKLKEIL